MDTVQNDNDLSQEVLNEVSENATKVTTETEEVAPLSEREYKIAVQKALKERKEKIKQNKEMLAEMELEVAYWKAQSDLLKYRFEKMDYYLKNLELEPKYLKAVEAQQEVSNSSILD